MSSTGIFCYCSITIDVTFDECNAINNSWNLISRSIIYRNRTEKKSENVFMYSIDGQSWGMSYYEIEKNHLFTPRKQTGVL